MDNLLYLSLFLVCLLIFIYLIKKIRYKPEYPYDKNPYFISHAERSFLKVLQFIFKVQYYIFSQVSLNRLLKVKQQGKAYWQYLNKINQKSVDFVLVDKTSFEPLLVIELNDHSHKLAERLKRDQFLKEALAMAKLKYLEIPAQSAYNTSEIKRVIEEKINT